MADFFLDPVGGNDANDGTTFANRWKTLTSGATAARIAPGDRVKVMASPDPTLVGNATWTDDSGTITLASACTQSIDDCDTAWTASANVTSTANTSPRKQGSFCSLNAFSAGFTTGKAAYRTLPAPLDLSAYEQVSFWFLSSQATAAGALELRLCSDTTGDTAVHTIPIDQACVANNFRVVVKDFGAALSTSIASVALYAVTDPGTASIRIDNIIACKAASAADSLTHLSLIGKNTAGEPEWYPIISIFGTTVQLGADSAANIQLAGSTPRTYRGTTETVATYKRQPVDIVNTGAALPPASSNAVMDSGTSGSPITFSGGWDRTNMSTQSGETWWSGANWAASMVSMSTARDWIAFEKIGAAHFTDEPIIMGSGCDNIDIEMPGVAGCGTGFSSSVATAVYADFGNIIGCGSNGAVSLSQGPADITFKARRVCNTMASAVMLSPDNNCRYRILIDKIDNNNGYGINPNGQSSGLMSFYNTVLENNVSGDIKVSASGSKTMYSNCLLLSTTGVVDAASQSVTDIVVFHRYGQDANDHRTYAGGYWIASETSVRHTASGLSWKLSPKSLTLVNPMRLARIALARIPLSAGTHDLKCWVRRDNTGLTCGIRVLEGTVIGDYDEASASMTAAVDTWEELTVTVSPTEACVVELEGWAYGGTTYNCWFDDVSVT